MKTETPWEGLNIDASLPSMGIKRPVKFMLHSRGNHIAEFHSESDRNMALNAVNSHEALLKTAKYFKEKYESAMHEFDFPNDDWSYDRDGDIESIKHAEIIAQAERREII